MRARQQYCTDQKRIAPPSSPPPGKNRASLEKPGRKVRLLVCPTSARTNGQYLQRADIEMLDLERNAELIERNGACRLFRSKVVGIGLPLGVLKRVDVVELLPCATTCISLTQYRHHQAESDRCTRNEMQARRQSATAQAAPVRGNRELRCSNCMFDTRENYLLQRRFALDEDAAHLNEFVRPLPCSHRISHESVANEKPRKQSEHIRTCGQQ